MPHEDGQRSLRSAARWALCSVWWRVSVIPSLSLASAPIADVSWAGSVELKPMSLHPMSSISNSSTCGLLSRFEATIKLGYGSAGQHDLLVSASDGTTAANSASRPVSTGMRIFREHHPNPPLQMQRIRTTPPSVLKGSCVAILHAAPSWVYVATTAPPESWASGHGSLGGIRSILLSTEPADECSK